MISASPASSAVIISSHQVRRDWSADFIMAEKKFCFGLFRAGRSIDL
jgi:hypothetical protein